MKPPGLWNLHSSPANCDRSFKNYLEQSAGLMPAPTRQPVATQVDRRRRRHVRYRSDFRVTVSYLGNHYQKLEGHCRDLSEAGMGILLAAEMNSGEVVSLSFSLPGSVVPWEVRAVARYRRGYQYGFEFLSLASDQRDSLKVYLKTLQPLD
jgi:hypothetical protein